MTDEDEESAPEYTATLRVWSETLSVADMTDRLGPPAASHERGDPKTHRYPDGAKHEDSLWFLQSGVDRTQRLDEHVEALLAFLETHRDDIEALRDTCEIDLFCVVHANDDINCSFVFEADLSRRIANWELPVIVCCL